MFNIKKKTVICWELTCAEVVGNLFNGVLDTFEYYVDN